MQNVKNWSLFWIIILVGVTFEGIVLGLIGGMFRSSNKSSST